MNTTPSHIHHEIHKKYGFKETKVLQATNIERFHNSIWNPPAKKLLEELRKRGVTDKTIRQHKLGTNGGRITIPIRNAAGYFVNIRNYLPGAKDNKVINQGKGYGELRFYPVDQLGYDRILLTGGEIKALVAAQELNEHDIGAITGTWGEGNWTKELLDQLKGSIIYVCMDIDEAGKKAAEKLCNALQDIAITIYKINLPLDVEKFPSGDINDFVVEGGKLIDLIDSAKPWEFVQPVKYDEKEEANDLTLSEATHASNAKKRVRFKAVVSAVEPSPFAIAEKVHVICDRESKYCKICAIPERCKPSDQVLEIEKESDSLLKMVGASDKEQHRVFQEEFKIPKLCQNVSFESNTFFNIDHVCLSSELDITDRDTNRTMQSAYCIGDGINLNETYELEGRSFPHPKTQQITFLLSKYEKTQNHLDNYTPTSLGELEVFRPKEWTVEGLSNKLNEIYKDLEANVTRIFKRRPLHLAVDLTYHSPLLYTFDGSDKAKGWLQTLIIGDSSVGKTETSYNMMNHYGLGERVDCDGATIAGLVGGVQKFGDRWFITWGKIPNNDRRICILEEFKGLQPEVIAKMKDMRSSGVAELTKIETRTTQARARLLVISNPRSSVTISGHNFGVDAVSELIGSPEDVRRFDLVMILDRTEVDVRELQKFRPEHPHYYTSELCRSLILYCWTCKNVVFEDESHVFERTNELCADFTDEIPIVDRGSMRLKLAKLSAALAGRTFSTRDDETILVRNCHIDYITEFLNKEYSKPCFGYKDFSTMVFEQENLVSDEEVRIHILTEVKHSGDFVAHILNQDVIDVWFIQDVCGWDTETARNTLGFLIRQRALKKIGRGCRKTAQFVALLKELKENPNLKDIPDHLKKGKY
jgi:hypothetical protein